MKKIIMALALFSSSLFANEANTEEAAIHQELQQALVVITDAINSGNYEAMTPVLSKDLRATSINQEFINSKEGIAPYFKSWFGPDKMIKTLTISFIPDNRTELSPDRTWGIVYGKGIEQYTLNDGRKFDFLTRWTATVIKEDGKWKIRSIHIGTNFLDNPLLNEIESGLTKSLLAGGAGGLLLGLILGVFFRRKKVS